MRTGQQLEAFSTMLGVVASVAVHLAALAYIATISAQFDFDFELTLPAEVEFGLTGEMEMAAAPAPPRATGATDPRWSGEPNQEGEHPTTDAGVPLDPDTDADTDTDTDADPDTEPDPPPVAAPTLSGPSRIPPGAQLALRVDMKRVRESALAPDVTSFLQGVPDWQLLLEGSGIDPVEDLDRLLVATPNLQRSKLVLAGRHRREAKVCVGGSVTEWRLHRGTTSTEHRERSRS
ncbi:MAG: hypothetical protein JRF48_09450 [Deltaproteobacteria bacterium]|nr:hypothetical protein [Deltaproteobacteria bacterium]